MPRISTINHCGILPSNNGKTTKGSHEHTFIFLACVGIGVLIHQIQQQDGADNNHRLTPRNRWYNVRYHHFWSMVDEGIIVVKKVDTNKQRADYLTKGLSKDMFVSCRRLNQGW